MGAPEIAVAPRRQRALDRDRVRAAVRTLPTEYVRYMLIDAIDLLPPRRAPAGPVCMGSSRPAPPPQVPPVAGPRFDRTPPSTWVSRFAAVNSTASGGAGKASVQWRARVAGIAGIPGIYGNVVSVSYRI